MAIADCIAEIREAAGGALTDDQVAEIADEVQRRMRRKRARNAAARDQDIAVEAAEEVATEARIALMIERKQRAINILVRTTRMESIANLQGYGLTPYEAMKAQTVGTEFAVPGARQSTDAAAFAIETEWLGGLEAELRRAGVFDLLTNRKRSRSGEEGQGAGHLDLEIAKELRAVSGGEASPTGNAQARQIAEIVHKYQTVAVERLNRAGAYIVPRWDYIVRQTHDPHRIERVGFEEWSAKISEHLDHDETFGGAAPEKFLQGAYDGLVSGRHQGMYDDPAPIELGFRGPANLGRQLSEHRKLHFESAEGWYAYNQDFGAESLWEGIINGLRTNARNAALMEAWGPNPRAMFDSILNEVADAHRSSPKGKRLGNWDIRNLRIQFSQLDGSVLEVSSTRLANIGSTARAVEDLKLGSAIISSITDLGTTIAELRHQDGSLGQALIDTLAEAFHTGPGAREVSEYIGVAADGLTDDVAGRFSASDTLPGRASKLRRLWFKANALTWWTNNIKRTATRVMSFRMARELRSDWGALNPRYRELLESYGLTDAHWQTLRQADLRAADGRDYLTADAISELSDEALAPMIGERMAEIDAEISARRTALGEEQVKVERQLRRTFEPGKRAELEAQLEGIRNRTRTLSAEQARRTKNVRARAIDDLATKIRSYFSERADAASPTPRARERAILHQGSLRGTPEGEGLRFIMQFKSFPTTVITRNLARDLARIRLAARQKGLVQALVEGRGDVLGLAQYIAMTTVLGLAAMQAKAVVAGKSPRDPFGEDWGAVWTAALVQGGGAGIFGDFLFGEANRFGGGALDTFAGPAIGDAAQVIDIWNAFRSGDDARGRTFGLANRIFNPLASLFYTKAAMNYLVVYHIQEMFNPGYLQRMERRIERENNQRFYIPPSDVVAEGGGFQPSE